MKSIIISGCSEGLGYELSKLYLEKGYQVIGISRKKPDIDIVHIATDLTKEESIAHAVETINSSHPNFDALINCAGVLQVQKLGEIDYQKTSDLFAVNVIAPMMLCSGLIELIKANEADIVNVGSTVGFKAYENQGAYVTSKWGVRGLNEYLQLELKKTKSRVIGFNPGGFQSGFFGKAAGVWNDLSAYMDPKEIAKLMIQLLELPKNMEVSEIIVNRK